MMQYDIQPLNSRAATRKKTGSGSTRMLRGLPAVYVLGVLLLTIFIGGFIWHDLRGAYHDTLAYWNVRLSGSAQDRVRIIALWLSERRTDAEVIAEDPLTTELLQSSKGHVAEAAKLMEQRLQGIEEGRGFLTGFIVDTDCNIVARGGSQEVTAKDLQATCESVYETKRFDVEASHLEMYGVWLNLATPVFVEDRHPQSHAPARHVAGAVILVFAPWKYLYPLVVGEDEPARSIETQVVWRKDKRVIIFLPKREVLHQQSVFLVGPGEPIFAAHVAQKHQLALGEFADYRGVKVFGAAKFIPISGGSLARTIDVDEALESYRRRVVLEGLAGALCILLFGFIAVTLHRRASTRELVERLKQQEALLQLKKDAEVSEERYRELFENANDAIVTLAFDGRMMSMNKAAERLSGYRREEALHMKVFEILPPGSQKQSRKILDRLASGEDIPLNEMEIVSKDGRRVTLEVNPQVIYQNGEPKGVQVIARDITDRKRTEEELRHREKELKEAQRLAQIGSWEWDSTSDTMSWSDELFRIARRDPNLPPPSYREFSRIYPAESWERLKPLVDNCLKTGEPYKLEMERVHPDGNRRWFIARGEAVLGNGDRVSGLRGTVQDITDRKLAEVALLESEERFRGLSDASFEGVAFSDAGEIVLANSRLAEMLGCEMGDLVGSSVAKWVAPEYRETVMERVRAGSEGTFEHLLQRKDLTTFPVEGRARQLTWKGKKIRVTAIRDISERKRAEQALQAEKDFSEAVIDSLPGFVYVIDQKGEVVRWNRNAETILGYSREELSEMKTIDVIAKEDHEIVASKWLETFERGSALCEARVLTKDGRKVPFLLSAKRAGIGRAVYIIGTGIDISDRKRAEEALRESEELFRQMAANTPYAFFLWDVRAQRHVYVNRAYETVWGHPPESLYTDVDDWKKAVHPEDRERMYRRVLKEFQSHPERDSIEEEFRIVRPDGSIRWVHMNRFPVRDEAGEVYRIGLVGQDITERKASEETLVKLKKAVDASGEVIFMTDREGLFTSVNPEFTRLYGYTEQEVMGKVTPRILKSGDKTPAEYADMWKTALDKRVFQGEIVNKTKDGRRVDIETSVSAISGDRGEILGFLAIQRDIAERKQAEEALRKSEARYRSLVDDSLALICTHTLDGTLLSVNPAAAAAWGGAPAELVGRKLQDLLTPSARRLFGGYLEQIRTHQSAEGLLQIVTKTGEDRFWMYRNVLRQETGKEPFVLGYAQDITDRKLAEEKLQEEKAFSDAVIDSLPGAFYVSDESGRMIRWNKNVEKMLGYSSEELAGLRPQVTIAEEERAYAADKRREVFERGQTLLETHVVAKNGAKIPVLLTGMRAVIGDNTYVVGMGIDITDRKRAEEALRESEERFRQMAENSPDMFWLYDVRDEKLLYVSPAFEKIWGRKVEELYANPRIWRKAIHPEDREFIVTDFDARALTEGSENEYRIVWPDGSVRWVHGRVFPIRDAAGEISRVAGIVNDVTDRRQAEEAVRREEKLFHAIVEDQTEMIVRWKPDGTRTFVNEAYRRMFGRAQGELVGTSFFNFVAEEDRERLRQKVASLTPDRPTATDVHRSVSAEGAVRWHDWTDHALFDSEGRLVELQSVGRDITERKEAEEALTISEARYRTLIESAPEAIVVLDAETRKFVDFNENAIHLFGLAGDELLKKTPVEVSPPMQPDSRSSRDAAIEYIRKAKAGEIPVFEWTHRNAAGVDIPCEVRLVRLPSAGRMLLRGSVTDITERKEAERALRASQEMFSKAFHSSPEPMCMLTVPEWKFLDVNKATCDLIGYSRDEIIGQTGHFLGLATLSEMKDEQLLQLLAQGDFRNREIELRVKSGEIRTVLLSLELVEIAGQPCILAQGRDVTEHRRAEKALRASDQRYRDFISHSNEGVWRVEIEPPVPLDLPAEEQLKKFIEHGYVAECNDAQARILGASKATDIIGKPLSDVIPEAERERMEGYLSAAVGNWQNRTVQFKAKDTAGRPRHFQRTEVPIVEDGLLKRIWGMMRDVTDLQQAEEALRASEERYRLLFERSLAGVVRATLDGCILECNEAFARIQGYASRKEVISTNVKDFYFEKSDGTALTDLLNQYPMVIGEEFHTRRKDGTPAWMLVSASLIEDAKEGPTLLATAFDITHWKELGEQLRQAQKMEAVGRLAGGVAHDFNNMLQIINGYSELVIDQLSAQDPVQAHVQEIKNIVERAAGLTRQLLAFSRQQVLAPQILDLNMAIANLSKMLRRLIGEDIELTRIEGHPLGRVKADPGQIDQVIMNLAVNARDAMPRGGKLTIETANVNIEESYALGHFPMTPGPYVMIAVSDTGHGMDAETQGRIFEPFFTTKEKGKGTGLGLATVYGIVKQSGGFIWVESELDKGTTFKVFLPPVEAAPAVQPDHKFPTKMRGSETVLLVEDEEYVRSLVRRSLQSKGYTVLEARNGQDALRIAQQHRGSIHLLITDVVMPGMSGRELAESLTPLRPEMKTLYMSGYADDAILHHGVLDFGTALLQKPFTSEALASKVRQVLEQG
jgi:PAS domain S-box-containing protein